MQDKIINDKELTIKKLKAEVREKTKKVKDLFNDFSAFTLQKFKLECTVRKKEEIIDYLNKDNALLVKEVEKLKEKNKMLQAENIDIKLKETMKQVNSFVTTDTNIIEDTKEKIKALEERANFQIKVINAERKWAELWKNKYNSLCDRIFIEEGWDPRK